jgi:hypothetical protein
MTSLKHTLAIALLTVAAAASSPLSAAQIGGPVTGPRDPGGGPINTYHAMVCWNAYNAATRRLETRCTSIFENTLQQCLSTVGYYLGIGGWVVPGQGCAPSSP